MSFTVEFQGKDKLIKALKDVPEKLHKRAQAAMLKVAADLQRTMVNHSAVGEVFKTNPTGELKRSWRFDKDTSLNMPLSVWVASQGVKYAQIHEYGGTVTPKNSQYLTIPLDANKTATGKTRMDARTAISQGAFFFKSKAGNLLIGQKGSGKGEVVPLFVLKKQITIPARLGFREEASKSSRMMIEALQNLRWADA